MSFWRGVPRGFEGGGTGNPATGFGKLSSVLRLTVAPLSELRFGSPGLPVGKYGNISPGPEEFFVRVLGAIVVGVLLITLALYFAHFQNTDAVDVIVVHYAGHGSQMSDGANLPSHTPLLVARAGDSRALADAMTGGGAWVLVASDMASPSGLMVTEKALTDRLIETDDSAERAQLITTIRELRRYREFATEKQGDGMSSKATGAADSAPKVPTTTAPSRAAPLTDVDVYAPVELKSSRQEILDSLNKLPRESRKLTAMERIERLGDDAVHGRRPVLMSLLFGCIYILCIFVGIFSGSVYEALGKLDGAKPVKFAQILRYARTAGTWQGIFAGPVVFTALVVALPTEAKFSLPVAILAYQNGFFWRATLKRLSEAKAASNPSATA